MRIFISGGVKNGKSYIAQRLAKAMNNNNLYYIATMQPCDPEDDERIARHVLDREGWGFKTIEQPTRISDIIEKGSCSGVFLLDSLTALLANEMFQGANFDEFAADRVCNEIDETLKKIKNIVLVSDFIYSAAEIYDELTEKYRKGLAKIDKFVANKCDVVLEIMYGNVIVHKGESMFSELYDKIN